MFGHILGHMSDHVTQELQRDHVINHMIVSQGHVPASQGYVGKFLSLLFDYTVTWL